MAKKKKRKKNWVKEILEDIEKRDFFLPDIKMVLKEGGAEKEELEESIFSQLKFLIDYQGSLDINVASAARILIAMLPGKKLAGGLELFFEYQKLEEAATGHEKINKMGERAIMSFAWELAFRIPKGQLKKREELINKYHNESGCCEVEELANKLKRYINV